MKNHIMYFIFFVFCAHYGFSQEFHTPEITVLSYEMDDPHQSLYLNYQSPHVSELNLDISKELHVNANLLLTKTNAIGGVQNLYLRGASADQIQISYDGAVLNDPSHISRGYNFSELSALSFSSVDIYYGSHASSMGSFANMGAINFKSRKVDDPILIQKIGSYGTLGTTLLLPISPLKQQWEVQYLRSRGMSSYDGGEEHDGVKDYRGKIQGITNLTSDTKLNYFILARSRYEDLDFGGGVSPDDQDYESKEKMILPFVEITHDLDRCHLLNVKAQRTLRERETSNVEDVLNTNAAYFLSKSVLDIVKLGIDNECKSKNNITLNADYTKESMNSREDGDFVSQMPNKTQQIVSLSFNQDLVLNQYHSVHAAAKLDKWDNLFQLGSYRLAYHSIWANQYTLTPSFSVSRKIPSLYQLYSDFGNPNLRREKSWQAEVVAKKTLPHLTLEIVPFFTQYYEMIDFNITSNKYVNSGENTIYGVESRNDWKISDQWETSLNVNYLRAFNEVSSQNLLLRPMWQASQSLKYYDEKKAVTLQAQFLGHREGLDALTFERIRVPYSLLFHLLSSYKLSSHFKLDLSLQNLLNKKYYLIPGYSALGLSAFMDVSYIF